MGLSCSQFNNIEDYNKVLPNLYIGNINIANNKKFIKEKNIKVIINCTGDIPNFFQFTENLEYYRIPVDDSLANEDINQMKLYLPKFVNIINNSLLQNKPVLVHCYAGRQRSACLIIAFLIYEYNFTLEDAYKFLLSKRREVFHYGNSYNFHESLLDYSRNLKK